MNRQQKIKSIYQEIANKERTTGCIYEMHNDEGCRFTCIECDGYLPVYLGDEDVYHSEEGYDSLMTLKLNKVIGHPVMIGDILELIDRMADDRDQEWYDEQLEILIGVWKIKTKPIDDQNEKCIDYIYDLIQEYQK